MYEIPGFARAQRAYENMEPDDAAECHCPDEVRDGETTDGAVASCPIHGWCEGCSSRYCEDCNG